MIRIAGTVECVEAIVESDPWIDLKISWYPRFAGQPLYVRLSGNNGGEVELKLEPATGRLMQAIVIDVPPLGEMDREIGATVGAGRVPLVDLAELGVRENAQIAIPARSVVRLSASLTYSRAENLAVLGISESAAAEYIDCGDAWVGVSAEGELVAIAGGIRSTVS
ncbi:hypothetical protein ACIBTZ_30330 [Micromonospora sp. NPDC049460]|uniref:hypothetical protein n=1 Tax=Micromonospora sp. NPDC049460 TaxID=3364272 RepID=UPI0037A9215C